MTMIRATEIEVGVKGQRLTVRGSYNGTLGMKDGSILRGETHLIEQAARDAFGWDEPEPADRLFPGKAIAVIGLLCLALWGGIAIAAAFAMGGL